MRFVVSLLLSAAVLAGCSHAGDDVADDPGPDRVPDELAAAEAPHRLQLAMVKPPSFHPDEVVLSDQGAVIVADLLYDGLTEVDGTSGTLRPGLASGWTADDEFRHWTFTLDPTAGIDAETVAASLGQLVWPPTDGEPTRGRLLAALTAGMQQVTATDPLTVEIELERSNAGLPWLLSGVPYSVVEAGGLATGGYEMGTRDQQGMELRLRERPPGAAATGGYETVGLTWAEDGAEAYRLLVDGVVDGAVVDAASLEGASMRYGVQAQPTMAVRYYVLNPASPDLADVDRRLAVLDGIDRAELLDSATARSQTEADGLVPPSAAGYREGGCGADCGPARDQAGGPVLDEWTGAPLDLTFANHEHVAVAEALIGELTDAGVPVVGSEVTARELAQAIVSGSTDLFAFGWLAPAGSVDAVIPPLLGADSPANVARVGTAEIESLLSQAATTADDERRWDLLERAHRLALAEAAVLPVSVSTGSLVMDPLVEGVVVRADGSIDLEAVQ